MSISRQIECGVVVRVLPLRLRALFSAALKSVHPIGLEVHVERVARRGGGDQRQAGRRAAAGALPNTRVDSNRMASG